LLAEALIEARKLQHNYIGVEHLFNAMTRNETGILHRLLLISGLEPRKVRSLIREEVGSGDDITGENPPFTPRAFAILENAVQFANDYGTERVQERHLLLAILNDGESVPMRKLTELDCDLPIWVEQVMEELRSEGSPSRLSDADELIAQLDPHATILLDKYGRDLTALAREGKIHKAIGREREIRSIARTLVRNKKNNPLLLGDAGVGKTSVVEGLAYEIVNGTAPSSLREKRIIQIEISNLIAGTSLRGQFEERLVGIVEETRSTPNIVLFIDELHTIVGAGDTVDSNLDAANILKPALSRGEIMCIGATTHEEYRKAIAPDTALDRRFRTITIDEPTPEDTLMILNAVQDQYAEHHKVEIKVGALEAAVRLSSKYMINRHQPDKALDLLDEACARVVVMNPETDRVVDGETVAEVLSEWTGIPITEVNADERAKYKDMEGRLKGRIIGQNHAVTTISDAIKTNRAGLSDPNRPVGVFMFIGPSGVGKTELARALAAFMFGSEDALLRIDMSEFHDEHTVARLIGAPPGYKDSNKGGQLTEALRRKPYSVILLDEVEKAAPEVFDIFLQVFDSGRLTDSRGQTVDARHAVWIMTSNIGTGEVGKNLGFQTSAEQVRTPDFAGALRKFFRPEFLNRLDEVIVFNPLNRDSLVEILDLQLRDLRARLAQQSLSLNLDASAHDLILNQGYDPVNGARPLRRAIERLLIRPLSRTLLDNVYPAGTVLNVRANGGALDFKAQMPKAEPAKPQENATRRLPAAVS
jgi:ATP-dependent Clp protease ATP-binding subunit ClpA